MSSIKNKQMYFDDFSSKEEMSYWYRRPQRRTGEHPKQRPMWSKILKYFGLV